MPPKGKGSKAKEAENKGAIDTQAAELPPPKTANERSRQAYYQTNPFELKREQQPGGLIDGLTPSELRTWANAQLLPDVVAGRLPLTNKAEREFWREVKATHVPLRRVQTRDFDWGRDRFGKDVGELPLEQFEVRQRKQASLQALEGLSWSFRFRRKFGPRPRAEGEKEQSTVGPEGRDRIIRKALTKEDFREETLRRKEIALLKMELYGEHVGLYAQDPAWDDVQPIEQREPEGAIAAIAYSEDYADAMAYLRAVTAVHEHSPRTLKLTEHIISMNPAHYTVWLYRFRIVAALAVPVPEELAWLNEVALDNLKNYQIWHHRQQLLDYYHAQLMEETDAPAGGVEDDNDDKEEKRKQKKGVAAEKLADLARSEQAFLAEILAEDTKNYHVWTYRQYLVRRLDLFDDPDELAAVEGLIRDDVRNNSAWAHRFFIVFSNPRASTPGATATGADPRVPAATVDRELAYAREAVATAPQNPSAWNYLRGVLAKSGRPLADLEDFAAGFVERLGQEDGETVRSSHALDLLADVYAETGRKEQADLALRRLGEKWDPIRVGYWNYRRRMVAEGVSA